MKNMPTYTPVGFGLKSDTEEIIMKRALGAQLGHTLMVTAIPALGLAAWIGIIACLTYLAH